MPELGHNRLTQAHNAGADLRKKVLGRCLIRDATE